MLRRGLDLEPSRALLDALQRDLRAISNRMGVLAQDAPADTSDTLGDLAVDLDTLVAITEVLRFREDTILYCVQNKQKDPRNL